MTANTTEIREVLERYKGMVLTYAERYAKDHHDRHHYEEDIRHADYEAEKRIQALVDGARIDELKHNLSSPSGMTIKYYQSRIKNLEQTIKTAHRDAGGEIKWN